MSGHLSILYTISIICIALSVFVFVMNRIRIRRILERMDHMLDCAIGGTFTTKTIDESMLSSLEFKLARYLDAAETSAQKITEEKENVKTLISDISHQAKTPVSSLLLYCELLQEQELDETSAEYVDSINTQAQKLHFLIATLIKMSRLETGILTLHPVLCDISALLMKACAQLAPKAAEKELFLTFLPIEQAVMQAPSAGQIQPARQETNAVMAYFDEKWTLEALCNILDNAIKYTEQGGITIKINVYELFCCIEIEDTGIGIPEEEQAQVFSRFYRSRSAADKEGVGIGLYLAREIITEENGYIKLQSDPGKGSVFAVYLPRNKS